MLPRLYYTSQLKGHQEIHVTSLTYLNVLLHHLKFSIGEYVLLMLNNFLIQHVRCIHFIMYSNAFNCTIFEIEEANSVQLSCSRPPLIYRLLYRQHPTPHHRPTPLTLSPSSGFYINNIYIEYLFILLMLITNQMQLIKPQ